MAAWGINESTTAAVIITLVGVGGLFVILWSGRAHLARIDKSWLTLVLALWLPILTLAKATSFVILTVFTLVNLSLCRIKLSKKAPPAKIWRVPLIIPVLAVLTSAFFLVFELIN